MQKLALTQMVFFCLIIVIDKVECFFFIFINNFT